MPSPVVPKLNQTELHAMCTHFNVRSFLSLSGSKLCLTGLAHDCFVLPTPQLANYRYPVLGLCYRPWYAHPPPLVIPATAMPWGAHRPLHILTLVGAGYCITTSTHTTTHSIGCYSRHGVGFSSLLGLRPCRSSLSSCSCRRWFGADATAGGFA